MRAEMRSLGALISRNLHPCSLVSHTGVHVAPWTLARGLLQYSDRFIFLISGSTCRFLTRNNKMGAVSPAYPLDFPAGFCRPR
uniref:Uncharacterized protein n=1 Tax=Arundo donax TaxID=35708 RepID=A0A0A9GZR0_ARUDO